MKKKLLALTLVATLVSSTTVFAMTDKKEKARSVNNLTLVSTPLESNIVTVLEDTKYDIVYDFKDGLQGFMGGFADLPAEKDVEKKFELAFGHAKVPLKGQDIYGVLLSGNNHSDDLFMYTYANIGDKLDLDKNSVYDVAIKFSIATDAPAGMSGVGGAPGESVFVKAGVVDKRPGVLIDNNGYYRLNLDKGNQGTDGKDLVLLGNLAKTNGTTDRSYENKDYSFSTVVKTDSDGNAYLIIGTDSGFEGPTTIYVNDVAVDVNKM